MCQDGLRKSYRGVYYSQAGSTLLKSGLSRYSSIEFTVASKDVLSPLALISVLTFHFQAA